jgi:energy-coupling factor transporter ATP-binding protein EcfA2
MQSARVVVSSAVDRTPRVLQLEGLFAVPPTTRAELVWEVQLPLDARPWHIGLIVGPSGSGKSTVARHFWPAECARVYDWSPSHSVLDAFPADMGIKDIVGLLSSVGFSDPPSWVRPFHVLSTGEQFRVTMARVLAEHTAAAIAVVDEFTSVVDRTVAQIGSAALARTVRQRGQQFIAVTCHEDVDAWLTPDWVYRPDTGEFRWRELQRPPSLRLQVARVYRSAWLRFRRHHYLDTDLNPAALCFVATWQDRPVAFVAALGFPHKHVPGFRLHRLVCLPDYQGVGIGVALADFISSVLRTRAQHVFRTAAHPAVVAHCARSALWDMVRPSKMSPASSVGESRDLGVGSMKRAVDRLTAGFEYIGPPADPAVAARLLGPTR